MRTRTGQPQKTRKELYKQQYEASKKGGHPFFPDVVAHDALVALLVVVAVFVLAVLLPATSEAPADPTSSAYNPRPEWYFLFLYQYLKFWPGYLEPIAAVVIPLIAIVILFLVPLFDKGLNRTWSARKMTLGAGSVIVAGVLVLEVAGALSAPARPIAQESPEIVTGIQVYRQRNCSYCHSINAVGGAVGPDLGTVSATMTAEQVTTYLQNPTSVVMHSLHPKLLFTTDELNALAAYLLTLGASAPYTQEAPKLTADHCLVCHAINGQGGHLGPDLSDEGRLRTLTFLENFITDPRSVVASATMPAFKGTLTEAQIQDIAAYLYSLRTPATTTPAAPGP